MAFFVVGLSKDEDVKALHDALGAAGLDADRLDVIDGGDIDLIPGPLVGSELLTSDGGASVPGINTGNGGVSVHADDSLIGRLGDFNIPDSEIENYLEALERGRSVVTYSASHETVDKVIATFRAAGMLNVKQF
jgi:hypothetical protein